MVQSNSAGSQEDWSGQLSPSIWSLFTVTVQFTLLLLSVVFLSAELLNGTFFGSFSRTSLPLGQQGNLQEFKPFQHNDMDMFIHVHVTVTSWSSGVGLIWNLPANQRAGSEGCGCVCVCCFSDIRTAPHILPAEFSDLLALSLQFGGIQHRAEGSGQPLSPWQHTTAASRHGDRTWLPGTVLFLWFFAL